MMRMFKLFNKKQFYRGKSNQLIECANGKHSFVVSVVNNAVIQKDSVTHTR